MTALYELLRKLKDEGYESVSVEMLEKNIIPEFIVKEKEIIIDAYNHGAWMSNVKDRLDYDREDYKINDADEYYEQV